MEYRIGEDLAAQLRLDEPLGESIVEEGRAEQRCLLALVWLSQLISIHS